MIMKICKDCKVEKPESDFYYHKNKKLYYGRCKECTLKKLQIKTEERKQLLNNYKSEHGCCVCGDKRYYVLDFHHRDGEDKEFTISTCTTSSIARLMEEMSKCDVMCANCHREYHFKNGK